MSSAFAPRLIAPASVALLVCGLAGCTGGLAASAAPKGSGPAVAKVELVEPVRKDLRRVVEQPGHVEAIASAPLHARVVGQAKVVHVDIGDTVKAGQVLVELDAPDLEAERDRATAGVRQAESERVQAAAALKVARAAEVGAEAKLGESEARVRRADADLARWSAEYARYEQLGRESAVTMSLVDETRGKLQSAEAARDEARAQVRSAHSALVEARAHSEKAQADLDAAGSMLEVARAAERKTEVMLGFTRIAAPFDGVVTRRAVDPGHLIREGPGGDPLMEVARTDLVTVVVATPEAASADLKAGAAATVKVPALGPKPIPGSVTRTSWRLDPATRTVRAEVDLPNPDGRIRPGHYVQVGIVLEEHPGVLAIPTTAVLRDGDKAACVRVVEGKARRTPIMLGIVDGPLVEVVSGLTESDRVVKANPASLVEGQPVEEAASVPSKS